MSNMLIIGDLHFGIKANSQDYLDFQIKWFKDELYKTIKDNDVKYIVFLGDINDSRLSLSPLVMNYERDLFIDLKNTFPNVEYHVILGNHDLYYKNTREVHSLNFLKDIGYIVHEDFTSLTIENRKMFFVPWILKEEMDDFKLMLAENKYDCLFGHLEINGFTMVKGVVDKDGWSHSIFSNCDKVFSGHYHLRSKKGNIQYVGTPFEISQNDSGNVKGIDLLNLETMETKFIKTKNTPKHLSFNSYTYPIDKINKKLINNNILKISLGNSLSESDKVEYIEKVNSMKPLRVIFEDESDSELVVNDKQIQESLKNTEEFLNEYINLIDIDSSIDKDDVINDFKEYYKKAVI